MKKLIFAILLAITAFSLDSCRKMPEIGNLYGQWQILSIDYGDGTKWESPKHDFYFHFNRSVAQLQERGGVTITGRLAYETDRYLTLDFPFEYSMDQLRKFGITDPSVTEPKVTDLKIRFDIDKIDSKSLIMTSQYGVTVTCRRY